MFTEININHGQFAYISIKDHLKLLLFHYAVYCFSSSTHSVTHFKCAEACIDQFCKQLPNLYKDRFSSYNSHVLLHIPEFVNIHGPLDSWSAFIFKNYLGILKHCLKYTNGIFKQSLNNLNNIIKLFASVPVIKEIFYSSQHPDNCALLPDGTVLLILSVKVECGLTFLSGNVMSYVKPLYEYPYNSYESFRMGYFKKTSICK